MITDREHGWLVPYGAPARYLDAMYDFPQLAKLVSVVEGYDARPAHAGADGSVESAPSARREGGSL